MLLAKQGITNILKTNLVESYPDFEELTAYIIGDIRRDGNFYFKAATPILDTNTIHPADDPTRWAKVRPSNRYAMIDTSSLTTSTNEHITPDWLVGTAYIINETSRDTITNDFYICIADITGGGEPSTNPTNWELYLPSSDGIIVEFDNPRYNVIAFGYVVSDKITIEFSSDDFATIEDTIIIENYGWVTQNSTPDWYSYYYGEFSAAGDTKDAFKILVPKAGKIRVTFDVSTVDAGLASCGYMVAGNTVYAGCTMDGVKLSYKDYSVKTTDAFGTTVLTKRNAQRILKFSVATDVNAVYQVSKEVRKLLATNLLVIGDESDTSHFENLLLLSYIEVFTADLKTSNTKNISQWTIVEKL